MIFNSVEFALFLPLVFAVYWILPRKQLVVRNAFLILASYIFYGWWDWRFLSLIFVSSLTDYLVGVQLGKKRSMPLLVVSIVVNLGLLGFFKYYNFFVDAFIDAFTFFGVKADPYTLQIVLPVGISFYTFQTLSYTIDIYRNKIASTRDPWAFFAYVSFFPQLVAGPIERARNLLPQFLQEKVFSYEQATDGLRQILWGLFMKMVVADNCAVIVDQIFKAPGSYSGSTLFLGVFLFAFQIYGDFAGYTHIAIGTGKLFGFRLSRNFAYPYFASSIPEFWRRWHISLTSWFKDYVYIPLGGNQGSTYRWVINILIVFLVSGLWHGAKWTFVFWGLINALVAIPFIIGRKNPFGKIGGTLFTFLVICITWVFFRAENLTMAFDYLGVMFSTSLFESPEILPLKRLGVIMLLLFIEWVQRKKDHALMIEGQQYWIRWSIYVIMLLVILFMGKFENQTFIYFQF